MNKLFKQLWEDESAQGMAEYMLLLVVVVTIGFIFKEQVKNIVNSKMQQLSGDIGGFSVDR